MSERWLALRHGQAELLKERARRTGNHEDALAWERYTRKTAQLQSTAEALDRGLTGEHKLAHCVHIQHQGRSIQLEHVITGPTGIFLVESLEPDSPDWHSDLVQNLAFAREVLGTSVLHFTCLVIQRRAPGVPLPPGAHLVDSVAVALEVIRKPGVVDPTAVDEFWRVLEALRVEAPVKPARQRRWQESRHAGLALLAMILLLNTLIYSDTGNSQIAFWFFGLVIMGLPVGLLLFLAQLIPLAELRRGLTWLLVGVAGLFTMLMVIGFLIR